ncbi:neurotrophin 1-like [Procambarus clarkii]|uniref:neurotrophin 1-like n=1 Tax=Procambarus clarkii TaxID=6728 RepID=UPI0037436C57
MSAIAVTMADVTSHVSSSVGYSGVRPPRPPYHQPTTYPAHSAYPPPACANSTNKPWCLEDPEYPTYEIKQAITAHIPKFISLYADVADLNTVLSVERPKTLEEETYLCPSDTAYIRPLRAQNTQGKWRVIVNNIKANYKTYTQTTRIEECLTSGDACPLVPECYESKCLQKSIYHRFLVYDPYDQYFPFAIETFKLPASCDCLLGTFTIDH